MAGRDMHNFDAFFEGKCKDGKKYPFGVYTKTEADDKFATKLELDEKADELDLQDSVENLEEKISAIKSCAYVLKCASIGEYYTNGYLKGACYVGNNKIVYYTANHNSNSGYLVCWNTVTKQEVWRHELQLYHGNSITYNKRTNKLYIASCYDYNDTLTLTNLLFEVDLTAPHIISRTLTMSRGVYSCAYDYDTDKYYMIMYRGTTAGEANRIYVYDADFNEESYIDLELFPSVLYHASNQGVHVVHGGRIYAVIYDRTPQILQYDMDGKLVKAFEIPAIVNEYRMVTELQACYYDYDTDTIGIAFDGTDELHGQSITFADTNVMHDIYVNYFIPSNRTRAEYDVYVKNIDNINYTPAHVDRVLHSVSDALSMQSVYNGKLNIVLVYGSQDIPNSLHLINPQNCDINFGGIACEGGIIVEGGKCSLHDLKISGSVTYSVIKSAFLALDSADVFVYHYQIEAPEPEDDETTYCFHAYNNSIINLLLELESHSGSLGYCGSNGSIVSSADDSSIIETSSYGLVRYRRPLYSGEISQGSTYQIDANVGWSAYNHLLIDTVIDGTCDVTVADIRPNSINNKVKIGASFFVSVNNEPVFCYREAILTINRTSNTFYVDSIRQWGTNQQSSETLSMEIHMFATRL